MTGKAVFFQVRPKIVLVDNVSVDVFSFDSCFFASHRFSTHNQRISCANYISLFGLKQMFNSIPLQQSSSSFARGIHYKLL